MAQPDSMFASRFVTASDGLRLHYRDYDPAAARHPPVVCLPGLTRTSADFHRLASAIAQSGRRVLAVDYRGRGLSDYDPEPKHYSLVTECGDVEAVLSDAAVAQAVFIGTSRGGLITMLLAAAKPGLIRGAVLNDIGPVIEAAGLERIRNYVGRLPRPSSWAEAVLILKSIAGSQFPGLAEEDWRHYAELTFKREDGAFRLVYDPALMQNFTAMDTADVPTLWPQFEALGPVPVLVIRGEYSDLLAVDTVTEMQRRHSDCRHLTIQGQGHAPFLNDAVSITSILDHVKRCSGLGAD